MSCRWNSLRALLLGGIAFDTPDGGSRAASSSVAEDTCFRCSQDRDTARASSYSRKIPVVSYFPGSVRGLGPGSEVTMHGLVVGHVTSVQLVYDAAKDAIVAPVHFEVEPERILGVGARSCISRPLPRPSNARGANGACGRHLQSASLITGQQMVALDFVPDAPPAAVTMEGPDFVLPTTEGGGFRGSSGVGQCVARQGEYHSVQADRRQPRWHPAVDEQRLASGPQINKALTDLSSTIGSVKGLIAQLDSGMGPALQQLPAIAAGLQKTMTSVNKLVALA